MGNSMGGKRRAKVMKINGDTFKLNTPVRAGDVVKDYPGHVLMDSEAVKHFGIRAKPLEPQQELKPKRVYFLVELPKFPEEDDKVPRRVRSTGIRMSAKDRLECLMLSRRAASDLAFARSEGDGGLPRRGEGPLTVKMRLTRAEMAKLVEESRDEKEVAERIMGMCHADGNVLQQGGSNWTPGRGSIREKSSSGSSRSSSSKLSEKRVRFDPTEGGEIRPEIQSESS